MQGDGEDIAILTCDCVDAQGRHVPTAAPFVHFYTNEKGTILGTGSDVCDHVPVTCPDRQMRAGLISVAVRAGTEKGGSDRVRRGGRSGPRCAGNRAAVSAAQPVSLFLNRV